MQFNLKTVLAAVVVMAGTASADSCNNSGPKWSDVGSDDTLATGFADACSRAAGSIPMGNGKQECQNVGTGKSFTINFMPYSSTTSGKNDPVLSQSMCEQLCQQAKSKCDYGGSWEMSAPPMDGGDEITVEVTVVLNENAC